MPNAKELIESVASGSDAKKLVEGPSDLHKKLVEFSNNIFSSIVASKKEIDKFVAKSKEADDVMTDSYSAEATKLKTQFSIASKTLLDGLDEIIDKIE